MRFRVWYRRGDGLQHEDFYDKLEAFAFAHGLLLLGGGNPLDVRDAETGELIDDLSLAVA